MNCLYTEKELNNLRLQLSKSDFSEHNKQEFKPDDSHSDLDTDSDLEPKTGQVTETKDERDIEETEDEREIEETKDEREIEETEDEGEIEEEPEEIEQICTTEGEEIDSESDSSYSSHALNEIMITTESWNVPQLDHATPRTKDSLRQAQIELDQLKTKNKSLVEELNSTKSKVEMLKSALRHSKEQAAKDNIIGRVSPENPSMDKRVFINQNVSTKKFVDSFFFSFFPSILLQNSIFYCVY